MMKTNYTDFKLTIQFFLICLLIIILRVNAAAQQDAGLSTEQKIQKAKEYYLNGKESIQQGNYSAADEEFKKAQQLLKGLSSAVIEGPKQSPAPAVTTSKTQSPAGKAWETAKKGESEEAISHYLKVITLEPKDADLHYNLAIEYLKTNQFMKASEALKRVIQLNPKDKDAYYNLGVLYESYLGDKKQAITYYTQYIKLTRRAKDINEVKAWIRQIDKEIKKR